ncbi:hypothetical protein V6N13_109469 [Hibiscus sabdariffa]|uniref:Secreted protein n=1 Tax=Hibiscus sabdariffa TaxID=183260 RepID=A0ABR2FPV2_9ROSI
MLAAAVVRPCLVVLVVVVLAQQPTGWCILVVSLCSVPGVAWHDACCLPSLRAIRGRGWCTACMCPSIFAWPMISPLNNALVFMAASSCRGRSGTIRVPFPDARHALALSLHCLVVGDGARHLPIMEVFLHTVQPLWLRFSGSIHNMRTWYVQSLAGRLPALVAPCTAAQACSLRCARCIGTVPCAPAPLLGSPRPLPRATWPDCISRLAYWNLAQYCSRFSSAGRTVDLTRPLRLAVSALPAMVLSHGARLWPLLPTATARSAWPMTIGLFVLC